MLVATIEARQLKNRRFFYFFLTSNSTSVFQVSALTSKNAELESSNTAIQKRMADVLKDMEDKDAKFRYFLSFGK